MNGIKGINLFLYKFFLYIIIVDLLSTWKVIKLNYWTWTLLTNKHFFRKFSTLLENVLQIASRRPFFTESQKQLSTNTQKFVGKHTFNNLLVNILCLTLRLDVMSHTADCMTNHTTRVLQWFHILHVRLMVTRLKYAIYRMWHHI